MKIDGFVGNGFEGDVCCKNLFLNIDLLMRKILDCS